MRFIPVAAAVAALAAPAAAQAHVTVQPTEAQAGGFARMDVRVPNERDDESTTKVEVKMPKGIYFASYEAHSGWKADIKMRKLAKPTELFGEPVNEEVDTVTFTGSGESGSIKPGQFKDFGLSVRVPDGKAGDKLTFPSLQTYSGGEVVRWIGAPDADEPAPQVTLTAAEGEGAAAAATEEAAAAPAAAATKAIRDDLDDKANQSLAIGALIVGGLGLLVGIAGLVSARRARP